jgi:hypothetical protein
MHRTPDDIIGIVLEKKMIDAVEPDHPIGIVHPFLLRREMETGTVKFMIRGRLRPAGKREQ